MNYDEEKLFAIVPKEKVKRGCVVNICTTFNDRINNATNKILIIDDKKVLKAVWYEEDYYSGKPYVILDYQIITEILEENIDVEEYLENVKLKYRKELERNYEYED